MFAPQGPPGAPAPLLRLPPPPPKKEIRYYRTPPKAPRSPIRQAPPVTADARESAAQFARERVMYRDMMARAHDEHWSSPHLKTERISSCLWFPCMPICLAYYCLCCGWKYTYCDKCCGPSEVGPDEIVNTTFPKLRANDPVPPGATIRSSWVYSYRSSGCLCRACDL